MGRPQWFVLTAVFGLVVAFFWWLATVPASTAENTVQDQCIRAEQFKQCMELASKLPGSGPTDKLGDAINECDSAARNLSMRLKSQVIKACTVQHGLIPG